jgi:hypothetical protein
MAFVDRFSAIIVLEFKQSEAMLEKRGNRYDLQSMITYTLYNAYIIAGDSDPDMALLDMLCLMSLGRIILEEEGARLYGSAAKPMVKGFRLGEKEILKIASRVLNKGQIDHVMSRVLTWRKKTGYYLLLVYALQ